jgi:hypothetical protein
MPCPSSLTTYLWTPAPAAASVPVDKLSLSRLKCTHLLSFFGRGFVHTCGVKNFSKLRILFWKSPQENRRNGPVRCMNLSSLLLFYLSFHSTLGTSETSLEFWNWVGPCVVCWIIRDQMLGMFCTNFVTCWPPWPACHQVWCEPCYTPHPLDKFYHHRPKDELGFEWGPKEDAKRFREARPGDHLLVTFQCDLCSFRNLTRRSPSLTSPQDDFLLCCIHRANLDAVWGRESTTVNATLWGARQLIALWRVARIPVELPPRGPFPLGDSLGLRVAVGMLIKSLEPGRYSPAYQQFETIWRLRATFSNMHMLSLEGVNSLRTVGGETAKMSLALLPTNSLWFERFTEGCLKRMGQDMRQDWAIHLLALHSLLEVLDEECDRTVGWADQHRVACTGSFAAVAFCGSFWGHKVFLTDLYSLSKYLTEMADKPFVIIPLLGKYKGGAHQCYHLSPMAAITDTGIQLRTCIKRLVLVQHEAGRSHGPAFGDKYGEVLGSGFIQNILSDRLQIIKETRPGVIAKEVDCYKHFRISRSFRRGATSTARARGVDREVIDLANWWRKFEKAKGHHPRLLMQDHYSDIEILLPELIKFSQAL